MAEANRFLEHVDYDQVLFGTEGGWGEDTGEGLYQTDTSTVPGLTNAFFHMPEFHDDPSSTPALIVQPTSSLFQFAAHDVATFPSNEGVSSAWENMDFIPSHGSHSPDPFHQGAIGMSHAIDFAQPWDVPFNQNISFNQSGSPDQYRSSYRYDGSSQYGSFNGYGSLESHVSGFRTPGLDIPISVDVFNVPSSPTPFSASSLSPNGFFSNGFMSPDFAAPPPSLARTISNASSFQTAREEPFFPDTDMEEPSVAMNNHYDALLPLPAESDVFSTSPVSLIASPGPSVMNVPVQELPRPAIVFENLTATPPIAVPGKKGRRGPLKPEIKKNAAEMRKFIACDSCRQRKTRCDKGIACTSCIQFYKCRLIHKPCRGQQLAQLASVLLIGKVFPRERSIAQYMQKFNTNPAEIEVEISLGFGAPMKRNVTIVYPAGYKHFGFPPEFVHEHVVYPWPLRMGEKTQRETRRDYVFPAVLAKTHDLKSAVDEHLTKLLDDRHNFVDFPLFNSPLKVLRMIYQHYLNLEEGSEKSLLRQALKLLILIHIGGDTLISPTYSSRAIIANFFGHGVDDATVTPCFIRGQLGPVFSDLALEMMRDVLKGLEFHCLSRKCAHFHLVISTFAVVFMAVESIQYHSAKDPFHSNYDAHTDDGFTLPTVDAQATRGEYSESVDALLHFYKACFSGCHRDSLLSVSRGTAAVATGSPVDTASCGGFTHDVDGSASFVTGLKEAVDKVKVYLQQRSKATVSAKGGDMTVFFDRLLAKLFLLDV